MTATRSRAPMAAQAPTREAVMAQSGSENFPVASYLLGRRQRTHLLAIYGFARLVDDLGDEAAGDRPALLDWIEGELDRLYAGAEVEHPVMASLAPTVVACGLPAEPFRRLIEANRRYQTVTRYETFGELLDYCQLSAAPVGELVLHVFDAATPRRIELSDRICAGLQVTEHLQDIAEDLERGRIYLPQEDLRAFGCQESYLAREGAPPVRRLIAFEVGRARALLSQGAPLARTLAPRARAAVAAFVGGGRAALDVLERSGYPVALAHEPASKRSFLSGWLQAVGGR